MSNVDTYQSFDKLRPSDKRYIDEDMNRVWPAAALCSKLQIGAAMSCGERRSCLLPPVINGADHILDLHSIGSKSPAMTLSLSTIKGLKVAQDIRLQKFIILDKGYFDVTLLIDQRPFVDTESPKTAILVEFG